MFVPQNTNSICDSTMYVLDTRYLCGTTDEVHIHDIPPGLLRGSTEEFCPLNRGFTLYDTTWARMDRNWCRSYISVSVELTTVLILLIQCIYEISSLGSARTLWCHMIIMEVGIATGRGSIPGRDRRFLSTPQHPDRLWGPPSLLFNRYRRLFP
jgi:hypothetical protein